MKVAAAALALCCGGAIASEGDAAEVRAGPVSVALGAATLAPGDYATIRLDEPGWLLGARVAAARYRVVAEGRRFVLRDEEGAALGWAALPATSSAEAPADAAVREERNGCVSIVVRAGAQGHRWTFVPARLLAPVLSIQGRAAAGPVTVVADFDAPVLATYARELAASVAVHARLLGADAAPPAPLEFVLLRRGDAFARLDLLLNGSPLDRPFTSRDTGAAYLHVPWFGEGVAPLVGGSTAIRAALQHELGHLVARALGTGAYWPRWLHEGMAEYGASRCVGEGWIDRRWSGHFAHARAAGTLPAPADVLADDTERDAAPLYAWSYLAVRRLAADADSFRTLLGAVESAPSPAAAAVAAGELVAAADGGGEAVGLPARPPVVTYGYVDEIDDGLRLLAGPGGRATAFFPAELATDSVVNVRYGFGYAPAGTRQAGLYLGCAWGRRTTRFLQVTVAPQRVSLWQFAGGRWTLVQRADLETALADLPARHEVTVALDGRARRLEVTIDDRPPIALAYPDPWPVRGTFVGVGSGEGIIEFRAPRIERP